MCWPTTIPLSHLTGANPNQDIMNLLQLPLLALICNTATFRLPGAYDEARVCGILGKDRISLQAAQEQRKRFPIPELRHIKRVVRRGSHRQST